MRLSEKEVEGICKAIKSLLPKVLFSSVELRLYGSRLYDDRKGGDIDLLLVASNKTTKEELNAIKHQLLTQIKKNIGEQKIDLLIIDQDEIQNDPFVELIYPDSISLRAWK